MIVTKKQQKLEVMEQYRIGIQQKLEIVTKKKQAVEVMEQYRIRIQQKLDRDKKEADARSNGTIQDWNTVEARDMRESLSLKASVEFENV